MSSTLEPLRKNSKSSQKQQNFLRFLDEVGTDTVDLYVGAERRLFRVHKTLSCKKIPYFEKMFNSGFVEASNQSAEFPGDDVEAFDYFLQGIYTKDFSTNNVIRKSKSTKSTWPSAKLYILAQKLCQPHLMDIIMDKIAEHQRQSDLFYGLENVKSYYGLTKSDCSLHRYIAHAMVRKLMHFKSDSKHFEPAADFCKAFAACEDLAVDVMQCLQSQAATQSFLDPRCAPPCKFHSHGADEECKIGNEKKMKRKE